MIGEAFVGLSAGLMYRIVTTVQVEILPLQGGSLVALDSLGPEFVYHDWYCDSRATPIGNRKRLALHSLCLH